jgi:tetratricopeptide (TPR) repeat protein
MILYRPVSLQEVELIYDNGMQAFPARLPQQPIFYPVLQLEYARQTAIKWNTKSGQLAGYVTQFKVDDQYLSQFEQHTVGSSQHQELWIPAEEVEEFNKHIQGHIMVVEAYFSDGFQGFVPDQFGMQGKNAVEQFTWLANTYIYKRMDFYLEIKRNHKAVFLNYPFWQKHTFENPNLKEKILKAIREAWFTSFPKNPLVSSVQEDVLPEADSTASPVVSPVREESTPITQTRAPILPKPQRENIPLKKRTESNLIAKVIHEDVTPEETVIAAPAAVSPPEESHPTQETDSHLTRALRFAADGNYDGARDELSRAIVENPEDVTAQTRLGVAFHKLGDDERALSCYETALRIDPKYADAHYFRANILYQRGNIREAIAGYTIAIGLNPDLIEAEQDAGPQDRLTDYTHLPAEMYRIAKPARRILDLNKLLAANPLRTKLFKERASQYYRLWNYEQAISDYSSALSIEPDDAGALHSRGVAFEQLGDYDRALADYQKAIVINPQLADIYMNRGVTLGKIGNFRQSVDTLTDALRLSPQNPDAYFNRGMSYFQLGDFENAIHDFSNVIQFAPEDEDAYYWRGISFEAAGYIGEAIADYKQFLQISQNPRLRDEVEQRLHQWE